MQFTADPQELLEISRFSFDSVLATASTIPLERLNIAHGEKWSAGQLLEHILRSQVGIIRTLNGPRREAGRDPLKEVPLIEHVLNNDSEAHQASEGLSPDSSPKDPGLLITKIKSNKAQMMDAIKTLPMDQLYTGYKHWAFGLLSGAEWVYLEYFHTARHLRQILQRLQ